MVESSAHQQQRRNQPALPRSKCGAAEEEEEEEEGNRSLATLSTASSLSPDFPLMYAHPQNNNPSKLLNGSNKKNVSSNKDTEEDSVNNNNNNELSSKAKEEVSTQKEENSPTPNPPSSSLDVDMMKLMQDGDDGGSPKSSSHDTVASENVIMMEDFDDGDDGSLVSADEHAVGLDDDEEREQEENKNEAKEEFHDSELFLPSPVMPPRRTITVKTADELFPTQTSVAARETETTTTESSRSSKEEVRLPHERKPSTIVEENTLTLEDDEANLHRHHRIAKAASFSLSHMRTISLDNLQTSPTRSAAAIIARSAPPSPSPAVRVQPLNNNNAAPAPPVAPPKTPSHHFVPLFNSTRLYRSMSRYVLKPQHYQPPFVVATWLGFWAMLHVTCANYVLAPMRDAIALAVGVQHMPKLTLASTVLAFVSSVPIGWLFEAPDPSRRLLWKRMGLTRGETQGTSLALFYRFFALVVLSYAVAFQFLEWLKDDTGEEGQDNIVTRLLPVWLASCWGYFGQGVYVAFFLVAHLMKLHSLSLMWGVTTEAMEYEDVSRKYHEQREKITTALPATRLQRLGLVGFGGTVGGILGSGLASSFAHILKLPGLLILAAFLLEISAELSIELGRVMQKHWEEQLLFQSTNDLASLDTSMKRSASLGSMKRVASGNSLARVKSATELSSSTNKGKDDNAPDPEDLNDNTFTQRLMRGATTILRSRLLMAIFTYNALYASTTVLLSFQRAALVANRSDTTSVQADTAFLANINMASSVAIFALQASGAGAYLASVCGPRGTLSLMPLIRLAGVLSLAWWHQVSGGEPPNLLVFLVVDECCKIMNLAVAKPVRESLWRGLSNEARYEAKPIVDTLANRWGGGSAAFLVSFINKTLDLLGVVPNEPNGVRSVFGFPPITFLCLIIAAWWSVVSADLGHIRRNIDLELKKRQ